MPIEVMKTEDPEVLAEAIRRISKAVDRILRSGLNREAVITLLVHETKLGRKAVERVLSDLSNLERRYTVPR